MQCGQRLSVWHSRPSARGSHGAGRPSAWSQSYSWHGQEGAPGLQTNTPRQLDWAQGSYFRNYLADVMNKNCIKFWWFSMRQTTYNLKDILWTRIVIHLSSYRFDLSIQLTWFHIIAWTLYLLLDYKAMFFCFFLGAVHWRSAECADRPFGVSKLLCVVCWPTS